MDATRFEKLVKVKEALDTLEQRYPEDRTVQVLHYRLGNALEHFRDRFTEEQFVALGGGTPKTEPE